MRRYPIHTPPLLPWLHVLVTGALVGAGAVPAESPRGLVCAAR